MRAMILHLSFVCCALCASTSFGELVLDFNSLPTSPYGGVSLGDTITEQGFELTTIYASQKVAFLALQDGWQDGRGSSNGTTTVCTYDDSDQVAFRLAQVNSNPFRLLSIDLAEVFRPSDRDKIPLVADTVLITGQRTDLSQISLTYNLDKINDGPGHAADFETVNFSSDWADLRQVTFTAQDLDRSGWVYLNFDNIRLEPAQVPEPSTLVLLGGMSVLGCVVFVRTRRRSI